MNDLLKSILVLGSIAIVTALLLTCVYQLTSPAIVEEEGHAIDTALRTVLPENAFIQDITNPESIASTIATAVYRALDSEREDAATLGYAVMVTSTGYGGEIVMIVGISTDKKVTEIVILSHDETKDVGTEALTEEYLEQHIGKDNSEGPLKVATITGATISCRAITKGVDAALTQVTEFLQNQEQKAEMEMEFAMAAENLDEANPDGSAEENPENPTNGGAE